MRKPPRARGVLDSAKNGMATALLLMGFACGASDPRTNEARDSGANGEAPSDGNPSSDNPSSTGGGSDGATATATGGANATGGMAGTGGAVGAGGADGGPGDAPLDNRSQPCTYNGTTYNPGQSFTINCVRYTCVGGLDLTASGSPCTDGQGDGAAGADAPRGGAGGSSTGGANGTGGTTTSSSPPTLDASCGGVVTIASHDPSDVLLVLDRSGSMSYSIAEDCYCDAALAGSIGLCANAATCTTRWTSLSSALNTTVSSSPDIRWGLKLYSTPLGSTCAVSAEVEVPIGANSAAAIASQIAGVSPTGNTPTAAAVTAATAYLKTVSDSSRKVILLATDGQPNCRAGGSTSNSDVPGTVAAITSAASAGFLVYVIGIGPSVGNLDNFALAGGTGAFYPATSPADLATALASISKAVAGCTYTLATAPPDPDNTWVYVDKNLVAKDAANGWSFGASSSSIVLNASLCDRVTSGAASTVQVYFGCPGSSPPPTLP